MSEADLAAVLALLVVDEEQLSGRPSQLGLADLRQWLSRTELEWDTWLYEDADGLAAVGWLDRAGDLGIGIGVVHPRAKRRGLGATLVERSETRARERELPRLHQIVLAPDAAAGRLLLDRGYVEVRRFWDMAIELPDEPPEPVLPEGFVLETAGADDLRAFHAALDEAFEDHWEHQSDPFDEWWARHSGSPNHDPTLWFLVRDGGEVAAVARNEGNRNGGGYVGALGVRRAWRGRGLGRALLLHTFREFHRRGVRRVTLGVDAQNATGATRLYESVGMVAELENVVYEKVLG